MSVVSGIYDVGEFDLAVYDLTSIFGVYDQAEYDFSLYDDELYNPYGYDNTYYDESYYDAQDFVAPLSLTATLIGSSDVCHQNISLVAACVFAPKLVSYPMQASLTLKATGEFLPILEGGAELQISLNYEPFQISQLRSGATLYPLPVLPVPVD